MLFVYHGNDIQKRREKIANLKETLLKKRSDAEVYSFDADEFSQDQLTELVSGRGLFEDKYIVFFYHVLTIEEGEEAVSVHLEKMAEAEHVFVLIEDELSDEHETKLSEHAHRIKKLHTGSTDDEQEPWPLADAYGDRESKNGWRQLHKALASPNNTPESIQGLLWWQTKMIWLAKRTDSADEANVSGYPYKKANGFEKNFSQQELYRKTKQLITMYHEAHRGEYELEDALEQFILEI